MSYFHCLLSSVIPSVMFNFLMSSSTTLPQGQFHQNPTSAKRALRIISFSDSRAPSYSGPQLSWQNKIAHGKVKLFTAK